MLEEKEEDKVFDELFRNKLENNEVIPSESLNQVLMQKLGRKEFLHFIPSRFNIWYLGGIVAAGTTLALILSSDPGEEMNLQPEPPFDTVNKSEISLNSGQDISQIPSIPQTIDNQAVISKRNSTLKSGNSNIRGDKEQTTASGEIISAPQNITGTVSGKDVLSGQIEGKDKLQETANRTSNIIGASVTSGCAPLRVSFKGADTFRSYRWSFGDGGFSDEKEPAWLFDVEGEYDVQLQVSGDDGTWSVSSVRITVYPKPVARFEISPEDAAIPDDEIVFLNYSGNSVRYKWNFGDGNSSDQFEPRHSYRKFDNYSIRLVALSEFGCADTLEVKNAFAGSGYYINFPNAFIPNSNGPSGGYYSQKSDEAADVFHPVYSGVSDYQLRIFTRLGILVFESNDINMGWDGYFKGQLCNQGVYVWKVRGSYINGEPFTKIGDVTLLKN